MVTDGASLESTLASAFFTAEGWGSGPPSDGLEATVPASRSPGCAICHHSARFAPVLWPYRLPTLGPGRSRDSSTSAPTTSSKSGYLA